MPGRREKGKNEKQYENDLKQIFAERFKTACQKKFNKKQNDEIGTKELFEIFKYVYPERATLYLNDKNSAVPTLRKWLNGESIPEFSTLLKLCDENCLNCSLDYLFGRIECTKHDIQFIHDYTGLSEKAIQILHKMKGSSFGRRLLASLEILILDVEKFSGDKYYKRFLELFSDYLQFSGDDNKRYLFSKDGEIKEEKPTHDEYGNKKFNKDHVTITSDRLKYMFIMEIEDTLKCLKEEYDKNPHFLD